MRQSGVSVHLIEPGAFQGTFSDVDAMKRRMNTAWERLPQSEKDDFGGVITFEASRFPHTNQLQYPELLTSFKQGCKCKILTDALKLHTI